MPDLNFEYGGNWEKITQQYFKEITLIYHPKYSTVYSLSWENGNCKINRMYYDNIRS